MASFHQPASPVGVEEKEGVVVSTTSMAGVEIDVGAVHEARVRKLIIVRKRRNFKVIDIFLIIRRVIFAVLMILYILDGDAVKVSIDPGGWGWIVK
jgi:predicted SPOUT superfamily RNA methylase MTH1